MEAYSERENDRRTSRQNHGAVRDGLGVKVSRPSLWVILGSFFGAHGRIFLRDKARFFACGSCSRCVRWI